MIKLLISSLLLGGIFPPFGICWDERVIPKWTMCLIAFFALLLYIKKHGIPSQHNLEVGLLYAFMAAMVLETIYIISELTYRQSAAWNEGVRGTFDTPSGLALHLCLIFSILCLMTKGIKLTSLHRIILIYIIITSISCLLLTRSRTGLISLLVTGLFHLWNRIKLTGARIVIFVVSIVVFVLLTFCFKSNSTMGRYFILSNTFSIIGSSPITGGGSECFEREYMLEQEAHFTQFPEDMNAMLADNVNHPLNEFLYAWVQYGILGFISLFFVLFYCSFQIINLCLLPFMLFSYPLNYPLVWVTILINMSLRIYSLLPEIPNRICHTILNLFLTLFFISWCYFLSLDIRMSLAYASVMRHAHTNAVKKHSLLEKEMSRVPSFGIHQKRMCCWLYNYMYEMFQTRRFDEALLLYYKSRKHFTSYDSELLVADILYYKALESNPRDSLIVMSQKYFISAHNMCPVRFAPLDGLLRLYLLDSSFARCN